MARRFRPRRAFGFDRPAILGRARAPRPARKRAPWGGGTGRQGMGIAARSLIKGVAASCAFPLMRSPGRAQPAGPEEAAKIDVEKAKAEGKVVLYTSLDTQIVDAINQPFTQKYGIAVQYFRGGS